MSTADCDGGRRADSAMTNGGGRGGLDPGRGGSGAGRGTNFGAAIGRGRQQGGGNGFNTGQGFNNGQGSNNGQGPNFYAGESSETAGSRDAGHGRAKFANFNARYNGQGNFRGGAFGNYHGGTGLNSSGQGFNRGGDVGYQNRRRYDFRAGRGDRGGFNGNGRGGFNGNGRGGFGSYGNNRNYNNGGRGYVQRSTGSNGINPAFLQEAVGAIVEAVAKAAQQGG